MRRKIRKRKTRSKRWKNKSFGVVITNEELENNFNSIANSYEDELDKLAYVELIKKTIENMTYLPNKESRLRKLLKCIW
ncbi:Mbov_0392 family ICE element protein [Mycoplasmopsis bovis]|uniref:Mbov_0392 family ICE element protein n=1 Tax=Mycoplasmopsis bovis TaxID=28903 RepID=UPI0032ED268A